MPRRLTTKSQKRYAKRKFMRIDAPIPLTKVVKLRYCDVIQLDPGATDAAVEHRFRTNSIFDPDRTGVGHQPRYHDTYEAMYENYEVLGSKITAVVSPQGSTNLLMGVNRDNDNTTTYTTRSALMEDPNSKFRVIQAGAVKPTYLACKWSAKKTLGANHGVTNLASIGSNPDENQDYVVWAINQFGTEDPGAVNVSITIDYIVRFTERKEIAQS